MKTPAISNPASTSGNMSPARSPAASGDGLFNQVLSREIADRSGAPEQSAPAPGAAKESGKNGHSQEDKTASLDQSKNRAAAKGEPSAVDKPRTRADIDARKKDGESVIAAAAQELLALVANLSQAAAPLVDGSATADGEIVDPAAHSLDLAALLAASGQGIEAEAADPEQVAVQDPATVQSVVAGLADPRTKPDTKADPKADASRELQPAMARAGEAGAARAGAEAATAPAQAQAAQPDFAAQVHAAQEGRAAGITADAQATAAPASIAAQSHSPLQQPHAAAAQAADRLTPRVGSSGWDQALSQRVVWMVSGAQQSASLTLNPPELGPLQVVLNVSNNQATANFTAAQPEVRQALENAMPKLREMLGEAGIQLGQASVNAGTPENRQGGFGERQASARHSGEAVDGTADAPVRTIRSKAIAGGQGLVDTFA